MNDLLDLVVRAPRAIMPTGEMSASIGVRDGRIERVEPFDAPLLAAETIELGADEVLLPGLVDTHVHINEPGRTEWEGFASATRAAAAGGITTVVDMPLNSIPATVDVEALEIKRKAAEGSCYVDVGFWGGAIPGNRDQLRPLHDAGVFGFKCFLVPSGVEEFPQLGPDQLVEHLAALHDFDGLMIVHAEDADAIDRAPQMPGRSYADFLASRPGAAERTAIEHLVAAATMTGARVHVVHLSSADAVPKIRAAQEDGVRLSVETCPHYLSFAAEEIPDGATEYKCCPPIRDAANRDALWAALARSDIDFVVSDHSPCVADLKAADTGYFDQAWGGISSLQLSLPAVWTAAATRHLALADVVRWMAERPASWVGLSHKGRLTVGGQADFVVFAPDATFVVDPARLEHRNPLTPYAGKTLRGVVRATWLAGRAVRHDRPMGRLLERAGP